MKNRKLFIFFAVLVAATLLCGFSGFASGDGILLSPLTVGLLSLVLSLAPRPALAPLFWLFPLCAMAVTGVIFENLSSLFVGITLFLTAALLYVCYYKRLNRIKTVIITAAAFLFGILALALFGLISLTEGDLSRAALDAQLDKLTASVTEYIGASLTEEIENLSEAVSSLIRTFIVLLPGYFCAAALLCSYLSSGLFCACMQTTEYFAQGWAFSLPRVNAIVYLVLLVLSYFAPDQTVAFGLNNVLTVLQMAFALYGFRYYRTLFFDRSFDKRRALRRYYISVFCLFLAAPVAGVILPLLSPRSNSFASLLLMLPVISYTVFYIGGLVGAFKTHKKPPLHDSK